MHALTGEEEKSPFKNFLKREQIADNDQSIECAIKSNAQQHQSLSYASTTPPPPPTLPESSPAPTMMQHTLSIPTKNDLQSLAALQTVAFSEKAGPFDDPVVTEQHNFKTYLRYHDECPVKLDHCRIIKSPDDDTKVLAACQLSWKKQQPPQSSTSKQQNEDCNRVVFIEWIACLPEHMNKGLGSTLLEWASEFARDVMRVKTLTLYCVKANRGAARLYRRRGFVEQNSSGTGPKRITKLSKFTSKITSILFLGMNRHWTILTMRKDLI